MKIQKKWEPSQMMSKQSIDFASRRHISHPFTKIMFLFWRLSIVRMAPKIANQAKSTTLGGASDFQILSKATETEDPPPKAEKKEATVEEPPTDPF